MEEQDLRRSITGISFSRPPDDEPYEAEAAIVLWNSIVFSGLRIVAEAGRDLSVIWTDRRSDGTRVRGEPPLNFPWGPACDAILDAYRRREGGRFRHA